MSRRDTMGRGGPSARDLVVLLAVALGLSCAVGVWGMRSTVALLVSFTFSAAVVLGVVTERASTGVHNGIVAGVCMTGGIGLVAALAWLGVLIVLALVVTSPALGSRLGARWRPRRSLPPPEPATDARLPGTAAAPPRRVRPTEMDRADVRTLDDAALCLAWRRSFVRLEAQRGMAARLAVVEQRQRYLDELQRRHGDAFQAWLESGARASGNPLPYLKHRPAADPAHPVSDGQEPESPV
jgi:hypothetical protein